MMSTHRLRHIQSLPVVAFTTKAGVAMKGSTATMIMIQRSMVPNQSMVMRFKSTCSKHGAKQQPQLRMKIHSSTKKSHSTMTPDMMTAAASTSSSSASTAAAISASSSSTSTTTAAHAMSSSAVPRPSSAQLQALFVSSAIPMVAFGFMDNLIMIQAGGYIDATFGATLGLATLSAAAMGQVVSDVSGVLFGTTVERVLASLRIVGGNNNARPPCLTQGQLKLPITKNIRMAGAVIGVAVGCLLGASSLFFVDLKAHERQQRTAELMHVVQTMVSSAGAGAVSNTDASHASTTSSGGNDCMVYLTDDSKTFEVQKSSSSSPSSPNEDAIMALSTDATAERCAQTQTCIMVSNQLYVPIVALSNGDAVECLGVLKFTSNHDNAAFTAEEEQYARTMARHLAIFMERLSQ